MKNKRLNNMLVVILVILFIWLIYPWLMNVVKGETTSSVNIDYDIMEVNGTNASILINITAEDYGIKKVVYPDGFEVFTNGNEKRTKLAIDYNAELGEEYIFKVTTGDGVETQKKIVIINNFDVQFSGITTTGFNMGLSLTTKELEKIEEIRYYVNTSKDGTSYQTSNIVSGLSDCTSRYVYAEIFYNSGISKKSSYIYRVTTAHVHNNSCYNISYLNSTKHGMSTDSIGYKDNVCFAKCSLCGRYEYYSDSVSSKRWNSILRSFKVDTSNYKSDVIHNMGGNQCNLVGGTFILDGNWSVSLRNIAYLYCTKCGKNYYFAKFQQMCAPGFMHLHYTDTEMQLTCYKSTTGYIYNTNW